MNTDGVTGVDARTDRQTDRQVRGRAGGQAGRQTDITKSLNTFRP